MASKRRNMFQKNKTQETTENGPEGLSLVRQYAAAICACISSFACGCGFVWLTPLMPRLLGEGSEVPMTDWQLSWVVSVIEFGGVLTPVPAALLADKWGRKPLLLLSGPLNLAAWIIVLASKSVLGLFASRFIQGMAMGIMFSVLPVYLAEIASTELRGSLGIFVQYCWHLGLIFEYSIGPFLNVDQVAWASLPSSLVFILAFAWLPESPHFLLGKGGDAEAERSLRWLRGGGDTSLELLTLRAELESLKKEGGGGWGRLFTTRRSLFALGLVLAAMSTYTLGGLPALVTYASVVLSPGAQDLSLLFLGVLLLVTFPLFGRLLDKLGRRPVFLLSSGLACFIALLVGLLQLFRPPQIPPWVNDALVVTQILFLAGGVDAAVPILQSELFPGSTRALASSVILLGGTALSFGAFEAYYLFNTYVGIHANFFVFAASCASGFLVVYFFLPETKGKTFDEIQHAL